MKLNKILYSMLSKIGLTALSDVCEISKQRQEVREDLKQEKQKRHLLLMETQKLKKTIKHLRNKKSSYPRDRDYLKARQGEEIELDGIFVALINDKMLISMVEHDSNPVCNHLWVKTSTNARAGDSISVKGIIYKYVKTKDGKVKENYGLFSPVVTRLRGTKV